MNQEFEIEHFGFTAEQLSLERKHFLQKIIRNALDAMVNKFNVSDETSELLRSAKDEVFENIWMSINSENEYLNSLDKKNFTIPDNVLLPPYFDHVKSYTEKEEQELDKHLENLKNAFLENSTMIATLKMEISQYKSFAGFVESELKVQKHLLETFDNIDRTTATHLDDNTSLINKMNK